MSNPKPVPVDPEEHDEYCGVCGSPITVTAATYEDDVSQYHLECWPND